MLVKFHCVKHLILKHCFHRHKSQIFPYKADCSSILNPRVTNNFTSPSFKINLQKKY